MAFEVHIHDLYGVGLPSYPKRGQSQEQVLRLLLDPPPWTDSVLVFAETTGWQVVVAFTVRALSHPDLLVVLDILAVPDQWRMYFVDSRHRLV